MAMYKCANPECGREFAPLQCSHVYCSVECRTRMKTIRELERKRKATAAKQAEQPKGCQRCGRPLTSYRHNLCDACKNMTPSRGVAPIRTDAVRASRLREAELIDLVVSQAQNNGGDTMTYRHTRQSFKGVRVG